MHNHPICGAPRVDLGQPACQRSPVADLLVGSAFRALRDKATYAYRFADLDGLASVHAMSQLTRHFSPWPTLPLMTGDPQFEARWAFTKVGIELPAMAEPYQGGVLLVDTPYPEEVGSWLRPEQVLGVVDHHADIDPRLRGRVPMVHAPVGANATLMTELYRELEIHIPEPTARLLYLAIMSNTAALRSLDTTQRDVAAAAHLQARSGVSESLVWEMFEAKSSFDRTPLIDAIRPDLPALDYDVAGRRTLFGQLEVINARTLIDTRGTELASALCTLSADRGTELGILSLLELGSSASDLGATYFIVTDSSPDTVNTFEVTGLSVADDGLLFAPGILTRKHALRLLEQHALIRPITPE